MIRVSLPFVFTIGLVVAAEAQEISESNYDHIDPTHAHSFDANSLSIGSYISPLDLGWFRLSSSPMIRNSRDKIGNHLRPGSSTIHFQLELDFAKPVCVIGFQLKSKYPAQTKRTHFSLIFSDQEGNLIDRLERWPARGTSEQAFSSQSTDSGFSELVIKNNDGELFGLRKVLALSCTIPTA